VAASASSSAAARQQLRDVEKNESRRAVTAMSYDFRDEIIAVTGGAGGIGGAMCHRSASGGARCVVVDVDEARAKKVAGDLPGGGRLGASAATWRTGRRSSGSSS
jgi:FlaA1/EpsC-like NDP-sugar epimerase